MSAIIESKRLSDADLDRIARFRPYKRPRQRPRVNNLSEALNGLLILLFLAIFMAPSFAEQTPLGPLTEQEFLEGF